MPLEIAVKQGQQTMESMGSFDDLEDALTEFNELINRRNWHQSVTNITLTDTDKNKCLAQYALQEGVQPLRELDPQSHCEAKQERIIQKLLPQSRQKNLESGQSKISG